MTFQNDPTTSLIDLLHKSLDILAEQTGLTARLLDQLLVKPKQQEDEGNQGPQFASLINTQPGDPRPILNLTTNNKPSEKDNETHLRSVIELNDPTEITTLASKTGEGIVGDAIVGPLRNQETVSKSGDGGGAIAIVGPLRNQESVNKSGEGIVGPLRNHDVVSKSGEGIVGPLRNHDVTNKTGEGIVGPLRNQEGIVGPLRNHDAVVTNKTDEGIVGPLRNQEGIVGPLRNQQTLVGDASVGEKAGRPDVIAKTNEDTF